MLKKPFVTFFNFLRQNPNFVRMVMWKNLNQAECLKQSKARIYKEMATKLLKQVLAEGIETGIFRKELDILEMVFPINMFCFSYFSNIYTMGEIMQSEYENGEFFRKFKLWR